VVAGVVIEDEVVVAVVAVDVDVAGDSNDYCLTMKMRAKDDLEAPERLRQVPTPGH
jgi:hypothetical protein